ncbi:efflux RND transporter permease subunit [Pseudomonas aeruginosa]
MSSSSSGGASVITLQFSLQSNLGCCRSRRSRRRSTPRRACCPTTCRTSPVFSKVNPADAPILTLAVMSDGMPPPQIQDLVDTRLAQKISQISGVGLVSISGGQRPAVRVRANPTALAAAGLSPRNLRSTVTSNNLNGPKGSFDGPTRASTLDANDQLRSADAYRDLIIAYKNGSPPRIRDVASVEDDAENVRLAAWANNLPAVVLNIQRQPGANVIEVVDRIKAPLPQLQSTLPGNLDVQVLTDRTTTIRASVRDAQFELALAVAPGGDGHLPVPAQRLRHPDSQLRRAAVADRYLRRDVRVPASRSTTLTLMALTIATGFVVDDAIVMVGEHRPLPGAGRPRRWKRRSRARSRSASPSSADLLSLIAVLILLLFMGDVAGRLFREFAITLAVAILISGFVS